MTEMKCIHIAGTISYFTDNGRKKNMKRKIVHQRSHDHIFMTCVTCGGIQHDVESYETARSYFTPTEDAVLSTRLAHQCVWRLPNGMEF